MIYHLSLQTAGIIAGVFLILISLPGLVKPDLAGVAQRFLRYETSRLLLTVFAYLLIVAGLFWVAIPYVLRDQINWGTRSVFRWRFLHAIAFIYGGVILAFALTRY